MSDKIENKESKSLFQELFQTIFMLLNKIPILFQPNKKFFAYIFVISWITLIVFTSIEMVKWFFLKQLNPSTLLFYILCFFVLVLIPMLITMYNEWEKRNNLLHDKLDKLIEEKKLN
jgi:hypothetical protein